MVTNVHVNISLVPSEKQMSPSKLNHADIFPSQGHAIVMKRSEICNTVQWQTKTWKPWVIGS